MVEHEQGSPWALGVAVTIGMLALAWVRYPPIEAAAQPRCSQQRGTATVAIGSTLDNPKGAEAIARIREVCQ